MLIEMDLTLNQAILILGIKESHELGCPIILCIIETIYNFFIGSLMCISEC